MSGRIAAVRVVGTDYSNLKLDIRVKDGAVLQSIPITGPDDIATAATLPITRGGEIDVYGTGRITEVQIIGELAHRLEKGVAIFREMDPVTMKAIKIIADQPMNFMCGVLVIRAALGENAYPQKLTLSTDGPYSLEYDVLDANEFYLPDGPWSRVWKPSLQSGQNLMIEKFALATSKQRLAGTE